MADSGGQKSEKPTPRRLEKARKEGNFPAAREFVSAVNFAGFVTLIGAYGAVVLSSAGRLMKTMLAAAFSTSLTPSGIVTLARQVSVHNLMPLLLGGAGLMGLSLLAQLAATNLGISLKKLAPDLKRLDFARKLAALPGQTLPMFVQALFLLPLVSAVVYYEVSENLDSLLQLSFMAPQAAAARVGGIVQTLFWRAAALFLVIGAADLGWQRHRYQKQLKMSKQDIREELKEAEGNPQMKMRIRRIQRELARRRMMKEVATTTAVVVNPAHYAVAIRYSLESGAAPRVVAKGKNYRARRIRERALAHHVPIVENPPLARALYASVEVGQEIPSHLYRAVAEILADIHRLMNGRLPG